MGDPCAGHKSVIATWRRFDIEKESISEENFGFDPPMGSTMQMHQGIWFYQTTQHLKCRDMEPVQGSKTELNIYGDQMKSTWLSLNHFRSKAI